jgi:hypothetical protein
MRTPSYNAAILLILFTISCKKDNSSAPLEPLSVFHKNSIATASPVRVFALSGEITNTAIVNRFTNYDNSWLDDLSHQLFPEKGRMDTIRVQQGGDMAVFDNYHYQTYGVEQSGNRITLTGKDTIRAMSYYEVFTRTLPYNVALYKPPVFSETLVTSTRGLYGFEYTTLQQIHLENEQPAIRAPWILGVIHNAVGSNSLRVQNKLDINFYKSLAAGDTIVLREYVVVYAK